MTISYHLNFFRIFKVWSMLHHGSVGRVQCKECCYVFTFTLLAFFVVYHQKKLWSSFSFLFLMRYPQQHTNQSEIGIGDKKLSVELYEITYFFVILVLPSCLVAKPR